VPENKGPAMGQPPSAYAPVYARVPRSLASGREDAAAITDPTADVGQAARGCDQFPAPLFDTGRGNACTADALVPATI